MKQFRFTSFLFSLFIIISCATKVYTPRGVEVHDNFSIDNSIKNNEKIDKLIAPYKANLDKEMNTVLSYTPIDLTKDGFNSTLGNLSADLILSESNLVYLKNHSEKIDICLLNWGGLRRSLFKGNIKTKDIYELMPFDNEVVIVTLTPEKILEMVDFLGNSEKSHPISGIEFIPNNHNSIKINGEELDYNKTYTLATNDFLQKGGDKMYFLTNPEKLENLNIKIRDLMLNYFSKHDTIKVNMNKRILK